MILKISYWNGTSYLDITSKVLQGFPSHETIDETLDYVTIIIHDETDTLLTVWISVKIEVDSLVKYCLVADIKCKERHTDTKSYEYIVTLIEPTKYLEKIVCPTSTFTNLTNTLKQQMERALLNVEPIAVGGIPRFSLSTNLINFLGTTPGADFFFDKSNLREQLDGMLAKKNARCEVLEITDLNNIVIDYYDLTETLNNITLTEILNQETVHNVEYLGTDIETYAENSFSGNRDAIYHPSSNGWTTFKTNEATLTTSNATIETPFPIEAIVEFVLKGDFSCRGYDNYGGDDEVGTTVYGSNCDMHRNVIDDETYSLLPSLGSGALPVEMINTSQLYKENTISFARGQQSIDSKEVTYSLFFTASNIEIAIKNAIFNSNVVQDFVNSTSYDNYIIVAPYSTIEIIFRIKYVPYIDAHTKISKVNYSDIPSTIISNQSERIIDLGSYGGNLYGVINRLGNKELKIDKEVYNINELYNIGDYLNDGSVLVTRDLAFYNNFIKAHYEFSKDFNNLNEKIGIDRRKRVYSIPLENYVKDTIIKEYMIVSFVPITDNGSFTWKTRDIYMSTFKTEENKPISNAIVRTATGYIGGDIADLSLEMINIYEGDLISNLYELSVVGYAMATSLNFKFKFMDNYSAGMSSAGRVVGGVKQIPNPYVDSIGEYSQIYIRLVNAFNKIQPITYSDIALHPRVSESYYNNDQLCFNKTYSKRKDTYEHDQFTVQLETLAKKDSISSIIIGFALAQMNALITTTKITYKVWISDDTYGIKEVYTAKGTVIPATISEFAGKLSVNVNGFTTANTKSWALSDSNNNLLIAVNKVGEILYQDLYFNLMESRV